MQKEKGTSLTPYIYVIFLKTLIYQSSKSPCMIASQSTPDPATKPLQQNQKVKKRLP